MEEHPYVVLDGLRRIISSDKLLLNKSRAQPMVITHDHEIVQVNRFRVSEILLGWMMKRTDGSCMLGKLTSNNPTTIKYQLWLGGERGYTSGITARKEKLLFKTPDKKTGKEDAVDSDSSDSSDSKLSDPSERQRCFKFWIETRSTRRYRKFDFKSEH